MGGLYWGIIFSTAVRTYLKGNILFLGFYLGSVYTMCRIVNPMMYDSVVYDYLKVIYTKWAKYFGIDPWHLTYWAHNSRGGVIKREQKGNCKLLLCHVLGPKGSHAGPALLHSPLSMAPMLPSSGKHGMKAWMLWSWILFHNSRCYTSRCWGRKGYLSPCPGSASFTGACLKR